MRLERDPSHNDRSFSPLRLKTVARPWETSQCGFLRIELSDGSKWTTQMDHAFAEGDRVVVSTDIDFDTWELINLDTVVHAASSKNETYYEKITASPYLKTTKE